MAFKPNCSSKENYINFKSLLILIKKVKLMKKIALVVTLLLLLSIGTFVYTKIGDENLMPNTITGLAVKSEEVTEPENKITEEFVKDMPTENIKVKTFFRTLEVPDDGKEAKINENGVYLKISEGKLYARHPKLYNGRWTYGGELSSLDIDVFKNKIQETKVLFLGKDSNSFKLKIYGGVEN